MNKSAVSEISGSCGCRVHKRDFVRLQFQ